MIPEPTPIRKKSFWKKAALPLGVLAIAGIGGILWARKYIYEDVVPIVEEALQKELNRPVKIGKVQDFSLSSLRLGKSEIPATSKDSDHVEIESIDVNFDLWETIQSRKLKIKINLVNPTAFFEEDKPGVWIGTEISQKKDDDNPGDVEVSEVKLSNATVELLPIAKDKQPRRSVKLQKINTTVELFDLGKNLKIASTGESAAQGNFDVKAEVWNRTGEASAASTKSTKPETKSTDSQLTDSNSTSSKPVDSKPGDKSSDKSGDKSADKPIPVAMALDINGEVRTQKMLFSEVDRLVRLPVNVESGELNSNLNLQIRSSEKYPVLKGTATFRNIAVKAPGVAYGVSKGDGDVRFDGKTIILEKSKALIAKAINVQTTGKIDLEKGFDLKAKTDAIEIPKFLKAFNLEPPVVIAGTALTEVNVTGPIETPRISGLVKNTKPIVITPPKSDGAKQLADIRLTTVNTQFTVDPKALKVGLTDIYVVPELGGTVTGKGTIALANPVSLDFQIQANGLDADKIAKIYGGGQTLPVKVGLIAAAINLTGSPINPKTFIAWKAPLAQYPASGEITIANNVVTLSNTIAQIQGGIARVSGTINDGKLALNVKDDGIPLKPFSPDLRGNISSDLNITGNLANLSAETIQVAGTARFSEGLAIISDPIVASIEWTGKQLNIKEATAPGLSVNGSIFARLGDKPEVTGIDLNVRTQGLSLASLPTQLPKGVTLSGTTDFDGKITGTPTNPMVNGNVALNALQINDLKFDPLNGTIAYAMSQGVSIDLAGRRDRIKTKLDRDFQPISVNLRRGDGTIDAVRSGDNFDVAMRQIDLSELNGFGLEKPLSQLLAQAGAADEIGTPTLGGQLNGNLSVNLKSQQLQAGTFQIDRFLLGNFRANSLVANVQNGNLPKQSIASANIVLNQPELGSKFNAQSLRANVQNINLANGSISGALVEVNAPQAIGFSALQIQADIGAGNLKTGQNGVLTVLKPSIGLGQAEDFKAAFFVSSTQFNLQQSLLRLPLKDDNGKLTGEVGSIALKANLTFQGEPKIDAEMDVVDGRFQDVLRTAQLFTINDLTRGTSLPLYGSAADVLTNPIGDTKASVLKQLKRFAEVNQIIAQNAATRSAEVIPTNLDIRGRFDGKVKVSGSLLRPDRLTASFKVTAKSLEWRPYSSYLARNDETNKLEPNYNRTLKAEKAILEGGLENGVLSIRPFILKSGNTTIRLSSVLLGEVDQQSGQLKIENLPIEDIQAFIPYPLDLAGQPISLSGNLNGTVTLSGERSKPNFVGSINLVNGALNNQPIQSAVGSFNYADGRFKFKNTIVANSSEPISIIGELPYDLDLPTGKISSPDRSFQISGRVKDDGLSLLNMLGQPITWKGGKGELNFDISSSADKPLKVQGELKLNGATINAQALPEDLTNVRGHITADFTGVHVEDLRGEFSRGEIVASGSIPIFGFAPVELPTEPSDQKNTNPNISTTTNNNIPSQTNNTDNINSASNTSTSNTTQVASSPSSTATQPLLVDLRGISINLKGLYQGGVSGRMVIGGSALEPKVGGNILLSDGRVILSDSPPEGSQPGVQSDDSGIELRNLKLRLGDNIRVVSAPILNFVAKGDLSVTGPLDRLQPTGRIDLEAGQVNLFTTQFTLARGYRNFAEFSPELGFDPRLNVRLITSVPEVTRTRIPSNNITSEISQGLNLDGNIGGVQTIRIQARVSGPASQLTRDIELKSSPSRSTTELIALLGGGFINTLGRGDDATLGIANFAGSALLTNVQSIIGNAIGLSEFRLFPTLVSNNASQTSTLGLAAEAGIDILRTADGLPIISATALRVLTAPNQTTQFGLRYRFNEQIILRGSTDFSGDNRAVVEFEGRF